MPFSPNSALHEKNYPRNIDYMPAVIFFASLDFWKKLLFSDNLLLVSERKIRSDTILNV